ncbi:hypothetical protein HU200_029634 [Digitaria exilis]|uniref:Uncharacterized protein n=1 Tax=Digitaria exilis TaxID=1010633 RepID=A0A835BTT8_9POAL|nr:hypothetical protein HU200_029634 [Digitaria exilis]CAB3498040.1 unnamed protein product [Digitaria exilis]
MLRQSPSRSHRSKKLRPSQSLQAFLLLAVGVWIVYQLTRSYGKQRVVVVDTDGDDGEPARRWLGRKGFVDFAAGQASGDDIAGVRDGSDDPLSQAGDDDDEDQEEADEDDGVDSDADEMGGGLAVDEEEDDKDSLSERSSNEDELKMAQGQAQNGLSTSFVPPVNTTATVQDGGAALLVNGTGGAEDGTGLTSSGYYPLKNNTGDVGNKMLSNSGSPGENQSLQINKNGTADSVAE